MRLNEVAFQKKFVQGASFIKEKGSGYGTTITASFNVKYDLIGIVSKRRQTKTGGKV
ncbi:MAG: hypothetical protein LUI14_14050 [Lachnospiraceae bacterium]|nr:hypothetical protein [Lachnospiraceae bacterium]